MAYTWTQRTSKVWTCVACSSDGTKLIAGTSTYLWTSTDSGATWTQRSGPGSYNWLSVASSADGTKLIAVGSGTSLVYTSTDSGANWTQRTGNGFARNVASSSDGTRLFLAIINQPWIRVSTDSGANWSTENAENAEARDICCSSDGSVYAFPDAYGNIFTNGYTRWTAPNPCYKIVSNSSGTVFLAGDMQGASDIYYVSGRSGWSEGGALGAGGEVYGTVEYAIVSDGNGGTGTWVNGVYQLATPAMSGAVSTTGDRVAIVGWDSTLWTGYSQPAPVAAFTFSPASPTVGQTVTFTDASTNTPTSWAWNFGDSSTSTSQNPTHAYASAGTFTVSLTATNGGGSSSPVTHTVTVVSSGTSQFFALF